LIRRGEPQSHFVLLLLGLGFVGGLLGRGSLSLSGSFVLGPLAPEGLLHGDLEVVSVGSGVRSHLLLDESLEDELDEVLSPSSIASVISSVRPSRTRSATRAVFTITSTAATRPPSNLGRRRWLMTPRRTPASTWRTIACFSAGKYSTRRPMVSAASIVCSVEKTR
jgi:hypothetical protein